MSLVNIPGLLAAYYDRRPDPSEPGQRVAFGTSGHRGSSLRSSFNEAHILAIVQAICRYRRERAIDGPLFLGRDTHALSGPAFESALEVLSANGVVVMVDADDGYTPTPVVSHAILSCNRGRTTGLADGIVITPSHNPPDDGGIKYNPPHGGPADAAATGWIGAEANRILGASLRGVERVPFARAARAATTVRHDFVGTYAGDLGAALDLEALRGGGLRIGVDPMGGATVGYWGRIAERFALDLTVVNGTVDPTFGFMPRDWDGKIRMDCSSPHAMAGLIGMKDRFDVAFGNDPDGDRHGVVTRTGGLMNPNHYLAAAVSYLFSRRAGWRKDAGVGKTVVSSGMIDRVAARLGRALVEVPVGFKWFVAGLGSGALGFAGEESAGASFLRRDGRSWSTDKDGIILGLLSAEMIAATGKDPGEIYSALTREFGAPAYERIDAPATLRQKAVLENLSPADVPASELAGEKIEAMLTAAPGNGASIGGLKVITANGWFAARPSGTEDVYKVYAESFLGTEHLRRIQDEARALVARLFAAAGENQKKPPDPGQPRGGGGMIRA